MRIQALVACSVVAVVPAAAGCGKTERSAAVGETLTAKGVKATVSRVETAVPVPAQDVTGLSRPAPGFRLVGVRVRVCNRHRGATGPFDFGLKTTAGDRGRLKYPERNYADSFETLRNGCDGGWVMFEIPRGARPGRVTYAFDDTGTAQRPDTRVSARFSWRVG